MAEKARDWKGSRRAGNNLLIPAGSWIVEGGDATTIQWLDPVERQWSNLLRSPAIPKDRRRHWGHTIRSDGFNYRIANISAVALGAEVTNGGADYTQFTTHVVASEGNSRWHPIVGGRVESIEVME